MKTNIIIVDDFNYWSLNWSPSWLLNRPEVSH